MYIINIYTMYVYHVCILYMYITKYITIYITKNMSLKRTLLDVQINIYYTPLTTLNIHIQTPLSILQYALKPYMEPIYMH
jgi:hypothetical protein